MSNQISLNWKEYDLFLLLIISSSYYLVLFTVESGWSQSCSRLAVLSFSSWPCILGENPSDAVGRKSQLRDIKSSDEELGRNRSGRFAYFVISSFWCEKERKLFGAAARTIAPSRVGLCSLCHFSSLIEVLQSFPSCKLALIF